MASSIDLVGDGVPATRMVSGSKRVTYGRLSEALALPNPPSATLREVGLHPRGCVSATRRRCHDQDRVTAAAPSSPASVRGLVIP